MSEQEPVVPRLPLDADALVYGFACRACGANGFPVSSLCRVCGSDAISSQTLAKGGIVTTFAPSGPVKVGEVLLDDGIPVLGEIVPADRVEIGVRVAFDPGADHMRFIIDA